ncbi:MAG: transcription antitermination factor NusB [Clostridia bacterium]|nr:transcription antitermination factor NusB [Clostridia bacterium]
MDRRTARSVVYKMVYATKYNEQTEYDELLNFCAQGENVDSESSDYIMKTYNGIIANMQTLTDRIMENVQGYTLDRVYPLDMVALLYAAYELLYTDTPPKVAISEAVNLVKGFSTPKSISFVNGVLSKLYKESNE